MKHFCDEQYRNSLEVYGHSYHPSEPYSAVAGLTVWVQAALQESDARLQGIAANVPGLVFRLERSLMRNR